MAAKQIEGSVIPATTADGGITYVLREGSGIAVNGSIARKDLHQVAFYLPKDIEARLKLALEGGSMSGALLGLISLGLDHLDSSGKRMVVTLTSK